MGKDPLLASVAPQDEFGPDLVYFDLSPVAFSN